MTRAREDREPVTDRCEDLIRELQKTLTAAAPRTQVALNSGKTLRKNALLPGTIQLQWGRCGKTGCRCTRGELHGPYLARMWRESGKLRKAYVRPGDLPKVRAACRAHVAHRAEIRRERAEARLLKRASGLLLRLERMARGE